MLLDGGTIAYAGPRPAHPTTPVRIVVTVDTVTAGMWDRHVHLLGTLGPTPLRDRASRWRSEAPGPPRICRRVRRVSPRCGGGWVGSTWRGPSPRAPSPGLAIYAAGAWLSVTGGHGDLAELPLSWIHELAVDEPSTRLCDGVDDCMTAVREQLRDGAEVIKVCASGGVMSLATIRATSSSPRAELPRSSRSPGWPAAR